VVEIVIASEAKQSQLLAERGEKGYCFVVSLLAMTGAAKCPYTTE
jgi:hypothetical protein